MNKLHINSHVLLAVACINLLRCVDGMVQSAVTVPAQLEAIMSEGLLVRPHPNLYILGTVHIGSQSARDVQSLIETVKPSNVIVEIPPSRLNRLQQKARSTITAEQERSIDSIDTDIERYGEVSTTANSDSIKQSAKTMNFLDALVSFPAFASEGYAKGGISGLLFSIVIVWSSLLKRSTTSDEEMNSLPRKNEFEAAVTSAERIGARIIPADIEFEDLIQSVANTMTPLTWSRLALTILSESLGITPSDPVRRGKGESMAEWENRRRDLETARASRDHGYATTPELSSVLVQSRDAEFARLCLEKIDSEEDVQCDDTTVCIVGLVHLDGIVDMCHAEFETATI